MAEAVEPAVAELAGDGLGRVVEELVVVLGAVVAAGEAVVVDDGLVPVRAPPDDPEPDDPEPDGGELDGGELDDEVEVAGVDAVWLGVPDVVRMVSAIQSSAYPSRAKPTESLASKTKHNRPRFHRWWTTVFAACLGPAASEPG